MNVKACRTYFKISSAFLIIHSCGLIFINSETLHAASVKGFVAVIDESADVVEQFAAQELSSYIKIITGSEVSIRPIASDQFINIYLSREKSGEESGLGADGFIIMSQGDTLFIKGSNPRGVLYGVYEFLEKYLGVRFCNSEPSDEIIPKRTPEEINNIIKTGIDEQQTPSFNFRMVSRDFGGPDVTSRIAKLRFNVIRVGYEGRDHWSKEVLAAYEKRGFDYAIGDHGTYRRFLSPQKYFIEHSEWSIYKNGRRLGTDTLGDRATFCTTNKDARGTFIKNLIDYVQGQIDIRYLYPWPSDAALWCDCEECKRQSIADRLLSLNIDIAKALATVRPDMSVVHFAYGSHIDPPERLSVPKELSISFSAWCRNFAYAFDDEHTGKGFRDALIGWSDIARNQGNSLIIHSKLLRFLGVGFALMPFSIAQPDMQYFRRMGGKGFDFHRGSYGWWTKGLNDYVIAKLAWNVDANVNQILDDYFKVYWGSIAIEVKGVYRSIERALPDRQYWGRNTNPNLFHTNIEGNPKDNLKILQVDANIDDNGLNKASAYNDQSIYVLEDSQTVVRLLRKRPLDPVIEGRLDKLDKAICYVLLQRKAIKGFINLQRIRIKLLRSPDALDTMLEQLSKKLNEVEAIENMIEAMCTGENRKAGLLWDNGQSRLDEVAQWRQALEKWHNAF